MLSNDGHRDSVGPPTIRHARDWQPEDRDNPRNFSRRRRISSTVCVTFLALVSTFGASIYSAGIHDVMEEFKVSEEVAILPLSAYTVGLVRVSLRRGKRG